VTRDVELDRLKMEQDYAFQGKQQAWDAQDQAWNRRSAARDVMDRACREKQWAYDEQQRAWEELQRVRDRNGSRIDYLNGQQESAFQNMKGSFDRASSAHDARDGLSARTYADEGHRYKAEAQGAVVERRQLFQDIRDAKAQHEATRPAFQRAKAEFDQAKSEHDRAKADHEQKQAEFNRAKAEFERAKDVFQRRLKAVQSESKRRRDDKRSLAERAGVPYQYFDDVWVSTAPDGTVNIYFGGAGSPNGPGHGHYAMDARGNVTYRRDPFDEHGGQNFTDAQQDYEALIGAEAASGGEFGFRCRFRSYDAYVESNTNRQGQPKIDIYYGPKGPFGPGHHHAVALREDPFAFVSDKLR
jgi:hypothetical protein